VENTTAIRFGPLPQVVGTISLPETMSRFAQNAEPVCDIIEVRLDKIGIEQPGWLDHCRAIHAQIPVLLTIRIAVEGGAWTAPEEQRLDFFQRALPVVAAIDVELQSQLLSALAPQKPVIVSFHDFEKTPPLPELQAVAARAAKLGSAVKIVTMVHTRADLDTLRQLLATGCGKPLCVLGMGELAQPTRIEFPALGSCLTYGYLDRSAAPGQLPAAELVRQLRARLPAYDAYLSARCGTP
jgi:3-dehydroquinate dehydratase I